MNTFHNIINALLDIFGTYCIYRIIQSFHIGYIKNKKIEIFSYILYHICNVAISVLIGIPIIVFLSNIIFLVIISFNYYTPLKKRILSIIITLFTFSFLEILIVIISGGIFTEMLKVTINSFAQFCIYRFMQLLILLIILKINKKLLLLKDNKKDLYWVFIVITIICMIYLMLKLQKDNLDFNELGFIVTAMILILTVIFSLYYYYINEIQEKNENIFLLQKNTNYIKQYELLRNSSDSLSKLQHDLKNHIIYLKSIVGDNEEINNYLNKMLINAVTENSYIDTGNLTIDSILNVKIFDAKQKGINVEHHITIPIDLNVDEFDMTEIMGNIMDVAIEKALLSEKEKTIRLRIRFDRDRLFVWIFYPYANSLDRKANGNPLSTSYASIIKAVEKYSGNIKHNLVDGIHEISIMLFIPQKQI